MDKRKLHTQLVAIWHQLDSLSMQAACQMDEDDTHLGMDWRAMHGWLGAACDYVDHAIAETGN